MKKLRLTPPIHSVPLKHKVYCGRIAWDATGDVVHFLVEIAKKKKAAPRRVSIPIFSEEEGQIMGLVDVGNVSQFIIAKLSFNKKHNEFENNYYNPSFPEEVQEHVSNMLKSDIGLKKHLEKVLSS